MFVKKVVLTNFKNYPAATLHFASQLNCFVGQNGMGKTNLLDALHVLCLSKSHLGLPDKNLVRHGENFYRLEAFFEKNGSTERVVAKFQIGQRKIIERNEVPCERLSDHIGCFPVVMIAPDDVALVQDGSEERRRFLDSTLSQTSNEYLNNLLIYNNLIKQRNALLKQFFEERRFDAILVESIDRQLPAPAQHIFLTRKKFIEKLLPIFQKTYAFISNGQETVDLKFESDLETTDFQQILEQNLEKDRLLQRTTAGIHRDDLQLTVGDFPARRFASQGQLKSYLLALRLAQFHFLKNEKNIPPLLLLDDIFDKLDEKRVEKLVEWVLQEPFGQIFITDTHPNRIKNLTENWAEKRAIFEIDNGQVF